MNDKNLPQIDNKNENKNLEESLTDYTLDKTLGKGNFGKVKLGIHKLTKEKVSNK